MKPRRISVEGFTCYRQRQELDFSGMGLMAISGATGAGKSSLLDAIMFALYGRVPRVDREHRQLISLGADRAVVQLEFEHAQGVHRITRESRARAPKVLLEHQLEGGVWEGVANGAREVEAHVQRLVGLPFEAFTQAVVLPQGRFAAFLQAEPRQRRRLLMELLRLGRYESMRELARARADRASGHLENLQQRDRDAGVLSPQEIAALKQQHAAALRQHAALNTQADTLADRFSELTTAAAQTAALQQCRTQMAQLERGAPALAADLQRLQRHQSLAPLAPLWAEVSAAAASLHAATTQANAAQEHAEACAARAQKAQQAASTAQTALQQAQPQHDRLEQLMAAQARLQALAQHRQRADALKAACATHMARHQALDAQAQRQARVHSALQEERAERQTARDALGFDAARSGVLSELVEEAHALAQLRNTLGEHRQMAADAVQTQAAASNAVVEAGESAAAAEKEESDARAHMAHTQAEHQHALAHRVAQGLRAQLQAGQPCPVCAQTVTQPPHANPSSPHDGAPPDDERLTKAAHRLEQAATASARAQERLAGAQRQHTTAQQAAHTVEARAQATAARLEVAQQMLLTRLDPAPPGDVEVETWVLDQAARLQRLAQRHHEANAAVADAVERASAASQTLQRTQADAVAAQASAAGAQADLDAALEQVASAVLALGDLAGVADPQAEATALRAAWDTLTVAEGRARQDAAASEATAAEAQRHHRTRLDEVETIRRACEAAEQTLQTACAAAGIEGSAQVKEGILPAAEHAVITARVAQHQQQRQLLDGQRAHLEDVLGGQEVGEDQVASAREERGRVRALATQSAETAAQMGAAVQAAQQAAQRAVEVRGTLKGVEHDWRIHRQLAEDLRSDRFQEFLLTQVFDELVRGASVRLLELTGRYTLQFDGSEFWVEDHDNARERRRSGTLSGGETFLASLALALELSQQVQRAAGAVPLQSLFVDEGFGALDPETLDAVTGALEGLQAGGRLVGIITHIPELTARMPSRVWVRKGPQGSHLTVEHD